MNTTRSVLFALLSLGFLAGCGGDETDDFNRLQEEGQAYHAKGESDKAIGYYGKALAIQLKALGAEHPDVATSYFNIGTAYADKGDKAKTMAYLLKAKAIYLKKLGAQHPDTKDVQSWIDGINSLK